MVHNRLTIEVGREAMQPSSGADDRDRPHICMPQAQAVEVSMRSDDGSSGLVVFEAEGNWGIVGQ